MKKVLLISPLPPPVGGIATWTINLKKYISDNGIKNIKHLNSAMKFRKITDSNPINRILFGILDSCLLLPRVFFCLLKEKYDLIHLTSSAGLGLYNALCIIRIAKLFDVSVITHWRFGRIPYLALKKNKEWNLLGKVISKCQHSIVIDLNSLNVLKNKGFTNVVYVPNPFLFENEQDFSIQTINQRSNNTILYVGHIVLTKGVFELVKAVSLLEEEFVLKMVGPYENSIMKELMLIAKRKNGGKWLSFLGQKSKNEIYELLRTSTIICLPSYSEGFPNVILEAMAFSLPVVATNVGAIPDILTPDSDKTSGICVPVKDVDSLKNAIKRVMYDSHLRQQMGENGYQKIRNEYSMGKVFGLYELLWGYDYSKNDQALRVDSERRRKTRICL